MCVKLPARTYTGTEPEFRGIPFRSVPFRPRGGRFRNIPNLGERAAAGARALLLSGGGRPGRESGQGGALALGRDFFPTTVTLGRDTWAQ